MLIVKAIPLSNFIGTLGSQVSKVGVALAVVLDKGIENSGVDTVVGFVAWSCNWKNLPKVAVLETVTE